MNILRKNPDPQSFLPLTSVEFEILLSLGDGDRHGYAMMQDVEERSSGEVTVRPGTLYRAISRLLDAGLITEVAAESSRAGRDSDRGVRESDDARRRYYALTTVGRRVATLEAQRLARQVNDARARRLLKSEA